MRNNPNKRKVYLAIVQHWIDHGYSPDLREIAEQLNMTHGGVKRLVDQLVEEDLLRQEPGKKRTIRPAGMSIEITLPEEYAHD